METKNSCRNSIISTKQTIDIVEINDSNLFRGHLDQKQFKTIYVSIYGSTENLPSPIIREISEYATGSVTDCSTNRHCKNDVATLNYWDEICDSLFELNALNKEVLFEYPEDEIDQIQCVAMNCAKKFGYFMCSFYGENQYYCSDCINGKGISLGLKVCTTTISGSSCNVLFIQNDITYDCGHKHGSICVPCNWFCSFCDRTECFHCTSEKEINCCDRCGADLCDRGIGACLTKCDMKYCNKKVCPLCVITINCSQCDNEIKTHGSCENNNKLCVSCLDKIGGII